MKLLKVIKKNKQVDSFSLLNIKKLIFFINNYKEYKLHLHFCDGFSDATTGTL